MEGRINYATRVWGPHAEISSKCQGAYATRKGIWVNASNRLSDREMGGVSKTACIQGMSKGSETREDRQMAWATE